MVFPFLRAEFSDSIDVEKVSEFIFFEVWFSDGLLLS